jgi:hypothetical protein
LLLAAGFTAAQIAIRKSEHPAGIFKINCVY